MQDEWLEFQVRQYLKYVLLSIEFRLEIHVRPPSRLQIASQQKGGGLN